MQKEKEWSGGISTTALHEQAIFIGYGKFQSKNCYCHRIQKTSISNQFLRKEKKAKEREKQ
jgi:hypothetical protein